MRSAHPDREARSICESTIELAHKLKMTVVAEGIETQAVYELLKDCSCDMAQGFLISRPVVVDDFSECYDRWHRSDIHPVT